MLSSQQQLLFLFKIMLVVIHMFVIMFLGTFNSWVGPHFFKKGGDKMPKKDFLISSLIIIILLLIVLLFVILK